MSYRGELKLLREIVEVSRVVKDIYRAEVASMRSVLEAVERSQTVRKNVPKLWKRVHARLDEAREHDSVEKLCDELDEIRKRLRKIRKKSK